MNIREISDIFKDTADNITPIKSYNFGWASDRVRQGNTEDFQELNEFPRIFFAVPTITASDQTRKQDTYQVTIFFDDLLGYDNEGDEDPTLQIDKWANLQQYANYFVQRLNKIKQTILPNYLFIPEAPSITFDSFTGIQRMITVQLSFNVVVPTNCDPGVITLVQCIANIVTSSNLTASLTTVLKFAASLEGRATVTADINFVQKVASSLNASALLSGDISFVQKTQASLLTSANVTGNITIPKTFNASLLATGTTTAILTVNAPSASLLLDLYPNAAAAYSLRKLRTAYSGSAVRVRRSSDNTEQDIGFVSGQLDTVSLLAFCGVGNGFVTTWYDQSGNANNATQTTQASQPQIVSSGNILLFNDKPKINTLSSKFFRIARITNTDFSIISVAGNNGLSVSKRITGILTGTASTLRYTSSNNLDLTDGNKVLVTSSGTAPTGINLISGIAKSNGSEVLINNNITTSGVIRTPSTIELLFTQFETVDFLNNDVCEVIVYSSNQSSNITGIHSNINTNYAIY